MSEYNLNEYLKKLLSFAKAKDSEACAEVLSEKFATLGCLLQVDRFLLADTLSGDADIASYIRLVSALTSRRITDKYKNGKKYLQNELESYIIGLFCGADIENVYVLLFDESGRLISTDTLSDGTVNASGFLPRKLLDIAVRKKASSVVIAHNHPRGDTEPSRSDIVTTSIAKNVLESAGIALTNHYIVAGFDIDDCISFVTGGHADLQARSRKELVSAGVKKEGIKDSK